MSLCSLLVNAVQAQLVADAELKRIGKIKPEEIIILPEGKVPAVAGQFFVTVCPTRVVNLPPIKHVRKKVVQFEVHVIHRVRDIPNDKFGRIYTDQYEMADLHDQIVTSIESWQMLQRLLTLNLSEKVPLAQIDLADNPPASSLPVRFSITREFIHNGTNLDPIHLYPGYFLTPNEDRSKIAGFRTVSSFTSPVFIAIYNPLNCNNVYHYLGDI